MGTDRVQRRTINSAGARSSCPSPPYKKRWMIGIQCPCATLRMFRPCTGISKQSQDYRVGFNETFPARLMALKQPAHPSKKASLIRRNVVVQRDAFQKAGISLRIVPS